MTRIEHLAVLIAELNPADGWTTTAIPGLWLIRSSTALIPRWTVDGAVFCMVAQGSKSVLLNNVRYLYDANKYLVLSTSLPVVGEIVTASRQKPFLGFSMELDFSEIGALSLDAGLPIRAEARNHRGLYVTAMEDDLLDASIRLLCLLKKPQQIAVLAPMIKREIFYQLLLSEQSGLLRGLAAENSQASRIAAGMTWLRRNALRPVKMQELAKVVNMSPSTMHAWFKAVTTMSPLQFQKQLRLQAARQILLAEDTDAASVSHRVGYESASQFSREYRRLYGQPPMRDIERLRS